VKWGKKGAYQTPGAAVWGKFGLGTLRGNELDWGGGGKEVIVSDRFPGDLREGNKNKDFPLGGFEGGQTRKGCGVGGAGGVGGRKEV